MHAEQPMESSQQKLTLFDDRYGIGAYARLLALMAQPCVSFAAMAAQFGVTRERVRQWQSEFLPEAPRGRARRRLCVLQQARQRLLTDPLFKTFYRHARTRFEPRQVGLIRARAGFRTRAVRVNGHVVAIRKARLKSGRSNGAVIHVLTTTRRTVDFVYYQLAGGDFLFVPWKDLPGVSTTFLDSPGSKYQQYRNTFAAAESHAGAASNVN
jgi:hypothetical protein